MTFYAAGNAANNNNSSNGDNIYTTAVPTGSAAAPMLIAPTFKKGKILMQVNGSNVTAGAVLEVSGDGIDGTQTFPLKKNGAGTKWVVKKNVASAPSGLKVADLLPQGATITIVVRNPDGTPSAPAEISR